MRLTTFLLLTLTLCTQFLVAANEEFYRIRIPSGQLSCEQEAYNLAERFHQQFGVPALSFKCAGPSTVINDKIEYRMFILELTYALPFEKMHKRIQSSYYGYSMLGTPTNNFGGPFQTMRECLDELTLRTNEFQLLTKKSVLASTCERGKSDYKPTFVIRIDTIGWPEIKLSATDDLSERYNSPPFTDAVEKIILAIKGQIVAHKNGFFYYYAKDVVEPRSYTFGHMRQNECESQLADAHSITHKIDSSEKTIACWHMPIRNSDLVKLEGVGNQFSLTNYLYNDESYSTFSECMNDKDRSITRLRSNGYNVANAICRLNDYIISPEESYYKMDLY